MINKILGVFSILAMICAGLLTYANTAYFPIAKGAELEQRVSTIETNVSTKLDLVIKLLDKEYK